jgi:WD40 repeat protein
MAGIKLSFLSAMNGPALGLSWLCRQGTLAVALAFVAAESAAQSPSYVWQTPPTHADRILVTKDSSTFFFHQDTRLCVYDTEGPVERRIIGPVLDNPMAIAASPDGKWYAAFDSSRTLRQHGQLVNTETSEVWPLSAPIRRFGTAYSAFKLAGVSDDGTVCGVQTSTDVTLWETRTRKATKSIPIPGMTGPGAFSPDMRTIWVPTRNAANVYSLQDGALLGSIPFPYPSTESEVAVDWISGRLLFNDVGIGESYVYTPGSGSWAGPTFTYRLRNAEFVPGGERFFALSDSTAFLFDVATLRYVRSYHSTSGQLRGALQRDKGLWHLFDARNFRVVSMDVQSGELQSRSTGFFCTQIAKRSDVLVAAMPSSGTVVLRVNVADGRNPASHLFPGLLDYASRRGVDCLPNGSIAAVRVSQGATYLVDLVNLRALPFGSSGADSVQVSAPTNRVVRAQSGSLFSYDLATRGDQRHEPSGYGYEFILATTANVLASCPYSLGLYLGAVGSQLDPELLPESEGHYIWALSEDGAFVAGSKNRVHSCWSTNPARKVATIEMPVYSGGATSVAFSPDNSLIAVAVYDSPNTTLYVCETLTGNRVATYGFDSSRVKVTTGAGPRTFVVCRSDGVNGLIRL